MKRSTKWLVFRLEDEKEEVNNIGEKDFFPPISTPSYYPKVEVWGGKF